MHILLRSTMRAALPFLALATLVSGVVLSGLFLQASAQAAGAPAAPATTGILAPVGKVDPLRPPAAQQATRRSPAQSRPKGGRSTRSDSSPLTTSSQVPAAATPLDAQAAGKLLVNFNGVSSLDSAVTNFGAEFEPPDQGLCAGNGFVVEPVNSAFTIYKTDGSVVAGPFNVNALFDEGLTEFTSDPRCYFDPATHTWFAIILFINDSNTAARTDIAVNPSGDPTTPWTVYHLDATDDGTNGMPKHLGCPCLGDQPLLGIDKANLYISTNEFSILGQQFNGAQIYALAKADLVALAPSVHFVHFDRLRIGGSKAASVQPALTNSGDAAEYFLSSLDPRGRGDNRIGVWALTNQGVVAQGGTPTLSSLVITSEQYGIPPGAIQEGATSLLDSGDDRMQQTQFINGDIWGALDTVVTLPGDTAPRAAVAWFRVHPILNGQQLEAAEMRGQGYVAAQGTFLLYPAIQVSPGGTVAIVFTISGATSFPSAAYTLLSGEHSSINIAAAGAGPYSPSSTRWGDYSFAVLDPSGKSFWLATEYIPPLASQTPDGLQNWGTQVFEVSASV